MDKLSDPDGWIQLPNGICVTRSDILREYYMFWCDLMRNQGKAQQITPDNCLEYYLVASSCKSLDFDMMAYWQDQHYFDIRFFGHHGYCGLQRFMFTVGVCLGLTFSGYECRFCFNTLNDAQHFYKHWDGTTVPVIGIDGCTAIK